MLLPLLVFSCSGCGASVRTRPTVTRAVSGRLPEEDFGFLLLAAPAVPVHIRHAFVAYVSALGFRVSVRYAGSLPTWAG